MHYLKLSLFLLSSSAIIATAIPNERVRRQSAVYFQNRQNADKTCIAANALQTASGKTGQEPGTDGIKDGQTLSATDDANFINFCSGETITNGLQLTGGSCNSIPMGKIPATQNMISAMIVSPQPGDQVPADQTFNISVQTVHLDAGFFTNPTTNYYTAPQDLNANGDIVGHCHVTVQDIGSLRSTTPPDPSKFAFFKGIDDAGNGKGLLQAIVADGLPVGVYRVCTMIAARNHQPVNMPVAQRGAQDDCTKFEVVAVAGNQNFVQGKNNAGNANVGKMESGKVDGKAEDEDPAENATNEALGAAPSLSVAASLDFGSCANPAIDFGLGFDGRSENSFQPADKSKFTHGSALNIGVITDFICNRLKDSCKASQEAVSACAVAKVATQGKTGQAAADAFNTALGVGNGNSGSITPAQPISVDTASTLSSSPATGTATRSLEFGSCTDPTIAFGIGFDGRQENSFKPNSSEFNHGSALNIGVITSFICGQLKGQCKAAGDAIAACAVAQSAAGSATGQAAADIFNESLGFNLGTASKIKSIRRVLSRRSFRA